MKTKQILIVDDEEIQIAPVRARLESRGEYRVDVVSTADEALRRVAAAVPDALLLDTTLPDMPAQDVCRALRSRQRTAALPCIMLGDAAKGLRMVEGLAFGADDFVTKPIDAAELEARLQAILRRRSPIPFRTDGDVFRGTHIDANFADVAVKVDGMPVSLTRRELLLLRALVEERNRTLSRGALLSHVWGTAVRDQRIVDSAMWKLRKKLRGAGDQIETVIGFGYRFNEPPGPGAIR